MQDCVSVNDQSAVGEVRRRAAALAAPLALDETAAGRLALAVTECATNILKHAGSGHVLLRIVGGSGGAAGVEAIAVDKGPGMENVQASMRDGYSTGTSPGTGLGSLQRNTTGLEVYSRPGLGTVLRFECWADPARALPPAAVTVGAVCIAKPGQNVPGDDWAVAGDDERLVAIVADGLGHGPHAATASRLACATVAGHAARAPAEHAVAIHTALRATRGAAAAVAALAPPRGAGVFCGIGNIAACVFVDGVARSLPSHNGTLGHQMRKAQEFDFAFPRGSVLVMHSDGVGTHWDLARYPGLAGRHPALVAAVIHRDFRRGTDDATVVALRHAGASTR